MKKIITLPILLSAFCIANPIQLDNHSYLDVKDEYQAYTKDAGLHFTINNSENKIKKIRAAVRFSGLDNNKKYYVSRTYGCYEKNIPPLEDGIVNFYPNSAGQYILDVELEVSQGSKDFCIILSENSGNEFKSSNFSFDFSGSIDGAPLDYALGANPLDNKINYNYINRRTSPKHKLNESFMAWTAYDNRTENLTEKEKFESFYPQNFVNVSAKSLIDLNIESFGTYKDTRMLMSSLGSYLEKYRWNESTFDGHISRTMKVEERMTLNRCWAVGLFNLYSYFWGNRNTVENAITQDEIVYMGISRDQNLDIQKHMFKPFGESWGGIYESTALKNVDLATLMNDVMPSTNAVSHEYTKDSFLGGPEIYNFIKENASGKGRPLIIQVNHKPTVGNHIVLVDGLALTDDDKQDTLVHLVGVDYCDIYSDIYACGNEAYVYLNALKKVLKGYITYDIPTQHPLWTNTEHPVDIDADGDGVVDFDEYYRFNTDENNFSSDNNGISDFDNIYNSFIFFPVTLANEESFIVDYNFHPSFDNQTLYALEYLSVNDNVSCYGINGLTNGYGEPWILDGNVVGCNIASESTFETNAISLGVNTFVGNVFSKGGILVRNSARFSSAFLYNLDKNIYKINNQDKQSASIPVIYMSPATWPFVVNKTQESISSKINNGQKIVKNGETFTISSEPDHNGFSFLKVESGGTLVIGTGEMYIGDIQIESGSTFMFEHPGVKSELHLNGNFIWRGTYVENFTPKIRENMDYATARGFKLIQHSDHEMNVGSNWYGTIVAPYSKIVLGQASSAKKIYGRAMGKRVIVHQRSAVYDVPYKPDIPSLAKKATDQSEAKKDGSILVPSSVNITGANRNTINFITATPGQFLISVAKLDGSVVASFMADCDVAGAGSVNWNSNKIPNGAYMLSVKHNGKSSGKIILLK